MRTPEIGKRLAGELRSSDLVTAGLGSAYYPAPGQITTDRAVALVFASLGAAPPWDEQIWEREHMVQLMVPAKGAQAAEINALEPLIEPIWDHFRPRSNASRLILPDAPGSVQHCYPVRYEASQTIEYAGSTFTTITVFFSILNERFAGDP